jgi:hypothetical protein
MSGADNDYIELFGEGQSFKVSEFQGFNVEDRAILTVPATSKPGQFLPPF